MPAVVSNDEPELPASDVLSSASEDVRSSSNGSTENILESSTSGGGSNRKRDVNGLLGKRGGKALKIHVFSPQEEADRRRSQYPAAMVMAEQTSYPSYPLYPLDLHEHLVDSRQDEELERRSTLSPDVAANGFGSPIEMPAVDSFKEFEEESFGGERMISLDEVPLTSKYSQGAMEERESDIEEFMEEADIPARSFTSYVLKTAILILTWYLFSTLLILYNKKLLGNKEEHFPFPLLMNTIHFAMQGIISNVFVHCCPSMCSPHRMSLKDFSLRLVPTALATAFDIDLTNKSLAFISITFETMCKSGAPVFILIFAFLFKLEVPSYRLFGIILIISAGIMLTVTKETNFNWAGFIFIMSANVMAGFRWTVTQLLLQKEEYGLNNPFTFMSVLTPVMAVVSLVLSLILEPWRTLGDSKFFDSFPHILFTTAVLLFGGALAFLMVSAEFTLLSATSAVTLTVAGVMKEMVTILVAVIIFKDSFTLLKGLGLAVIVIGVVLYNVYKYQKLKGRGSGSLNGNHNYVTLEQTKAVYELGDELDGDTP